MCGFAILPEIKIFARIKIFEVQRGLEDRTKGLEEWAGKASLFPPTPPTSLPPFTLPVTSRPFPLPPKILYNRITLIFL